jgi:hypothetical protein
VKKWRLINAYTRLFYAQISELFEEMHILRHLDTSGQFQWFQDGTRWLIKGDRREPDGFEMVSNVKNVRFPSVTLYMLRI